ncbi:DUF357 domain-containing protein [archaeon]|nr:DUF357 domain-containing protein [archaeon]
MVVKKDKITNAKIEKYYDLSSRALKIARGAVVKKRKKEADEIFLMVECYLSDSLYFKEKGDFVNAYGALNYAHGWLDCGARLKIFDVKDDKLFTV